MNSIEYLKKHKQIELTNISTYFKKYRISSYYRRLDDMFDFWYWETIIFNRFDNVVIYDATDKQVGEKDILDYQADVVNKIIANGEYWVLKYPVQ